MRIRETVEGEGGLARSCVEVFAGPQLIQRMLMNREIRALGGETRGAVYYVRAVINQVGRPRGGLK